MRTQAATAARPRRRFKLSPTEHAELAQHPFARIPGTRQDDYGRTVLDIAPTDDRIEAWNQGALLGLRMVDAAVECQRTGTHRAVPKELVALLANEASTGPESAAAAWRFSGFMRVLETVIDGYLRHRHHGNDAPYVIGLETAWREWTGRVVS